MVGKICCLVEGSRYGGEAEWVMLFMKCTEN